MKERIFVASAVAFLIGTILLFTRNTDAIFVGTAIVFFIVCIVYAEWCERL